jgi:hypothetical protein
MTTQQTAELVDHRARGVYAQGEVFVEGKSLHWKTILRGISMDRSNNSCHHETRF